jgi:hypothetical protein
VTADQFFRRLTTLVNTLWQASLATTAIATDVPSNLTAVQAGDAGFTAANTTAVTRVSMTLYSANHTWVGLTATISILLLLCGVMGVFFKYAADAPDVLGYVSTLVVSGDGVGDGDSSPPRRASWLGPETMDGLDRARLLRDVNVQIVMGGKDEEEGGGSGGGRSRAWLRRLSD